MDFKTFGLHAVSNLLICYKWPKTLKTADFGHKSRENEAFWGALFDRYL
ncbi:hypothetical protein SAMN04488056_10275 [Cohaesibacter marisflavi]|uniref:Uncharacterized protein n=1 Tax=Cohaesibacter marisflavi TaxID=655353 RepID=A0A1I5C1X3_9HYPH|nr:hypothetical protein SAMN04488056_10275 [Cohaesibacter marisflavi]